MKIWMILLIIILLVCIAEWIRELLTFRVTHYDIGSGKLGGLDADKNVVFLSDLHNTRYGKQNEKLLQAIRDEQPDYILIGGDMLVGVVGAPTKVAQDFVSKLVEICPVYYALGNHEQRLRDCPEKYGTVYEDYKNDLKTCGVQFLENAYVDMMWGEVPVVIYGVEAPSTHYARFGRERLGGADVQQAVGESRDESYQIMMIHNPAQADAGKDWGADLVLSGHFHGGVVRIPGIGGVITPQFQLFPKYSGELTVEGEQTIVVSKGLGAHTLKVRFLNPAEVVVLHFRKE